MASSFDQVPVRSARNRIIDALGIGDCYPLTDLNVIADRLKVPFGGTVHIPIADAQSRVHYELCSPKGQPLGAAFSGDGQDAVLVIETPRVQEDVTYRILATKAPRATGPALVRFLDEPASVKVGLDTTLPIEPGDVWVPGTTASQPSKLLDPTTAQPGPADPRLVPYGSSVEIRVGRSQEGVEYSLIVAGTHVSGGARPGDLGTIVMRTPPLTEDVTIQVRATKRFLPSENRPPEIQPLDTRLLVKVQPNPEVPVSVAGSPIVDYGADAVILIAASQATARYRVYVRAIPDGDFVHGDASGLEVTSVAVAGEPVVQVREPGSGGEWQTPNGYLAVHVAEVQGTGTDLGIPIMGLHEDSLAIVQATKWHRVSDDPADERQIPSSIRLADAAAILVRPDPQRQLSLRVPIAGDRITGNVSMANGQPGVMYELRETASNASVARPGYFHKRDDADAAQNKGIGQLAVEVDFILPVATAGGQVDPARQIATDPEVTLTADTAEVTWRIRALKAQTRVGIDLEGDIRAASAPVIRADPEVVEAGAATTILIERSRRNERYQLLSGGKTIAGPVSGDGATLRLQTEVITTDAMLAVEIEGPSESASTLVRSVAVLVSVRRATP